MENIEIWKDIKDYEGFYQVSNFGRVRSLKRKEWSVRNNSFIIRKGKILKLGVKAGGYFAVNLSKNGHVKSKQVHQLVAIEFLNHIPCGMKLVVNHKNFNRIDNSLENLEIVTARENTNCKHIKSSSKYTGVCWHKNLNKWATNIYINGKLIHLGYFTNEIDAHNAYQNALNSIK